MLGGMNAGANAAVKADREFQEGSLQDLWRMESSVIRVDAGELLT